MQFFLHDFIEVFCPICYITKNGEAHLTSQQEISGEGEFYPIDSLIHHTFAGYAPDADKIKQMVSKYIDDGKDSISRY